MRKSRTCGSCFLILLGNRENLKISAYLFLYIIWDVVRTGAVLYRIVRRSLYATHFQNYSISLLLIRKRCNLHSHTKEGCSVFAFLGSLDLCFFSEGNRILFGYNRRKPARGCMVPEGWTDPELQTKLRLLSRPLFPEPFLWKYRLCTPEDLLSLPESEAPALL